MIPEPVAGLVFNAESTFADLTPDAAITANAILPGPTSLIRRFEICEDIANLVVFTVSKKLRPSRAQLYTSMAAWCLDSRNHTSDSTTRLHSGHCIPMFVAHELGVRTGNR